MEAVPFIRTIGIASALADRLLESRRPSVVRRLSGPELRAEAGAALAFALVAAAMAVSLHASVAFDPFAAALLVGSYALVARVTFKFGPGFARPTQLVFVPLLFLLPTPLVPALVAAGSVLSAAPELLRRRCPPERVLVSIADSWYAVGPALVVALAGAAVPAESAWPVFALALAAQFSGDLLASSVRERLGAGVSPRELAQVLSLVYAVDVLLAPIGLLALFASTTQHPYAFLLVVPPGGMLAVIARERDRRLERELELGRAQRRSARELAMQAEALQRGADRLERAHRRVGEAVASSFDRDALERLLLTTSVEALGAHAGRLTTRGAFGAPAPRLEAGEARPVAQVLAAAEADVFAGDGPQLITQGDATALAVPLGRPSAPGDRRRRAEALVVARTGAPFSASECDLLEHLAGQAAISLENASLHELVKRQAMTDELTGLVNHRRLQQVIGDEVAESHRTGRPVALLMLDIDNFKSINDTYGHRQGDRVLGDVAEALLGASRPGDLAGRYGGEELALVLPGTTLEQAGIVAERARAAIAALRVRAADGTRIRVTASFGVAAVPACAADREALVEAADAAMYDAKRAGKNRTVQAPTAGAPGAGRFTRAPTQARA
jgi:diguanylate cyclase (GGDEF)-like protein